MGKDAPDGEDVRCGGDGGLDLLAQSLCDSVLFYHGFGFGYGYKPAMAESIGKR